MRTPIPRATWTRTATSRCFHTWAELDKPGTIAKWKQNVFKKDSKRFSDALSEEEGAYLDHFKVQKLDPNRLNAVQIEEAHTLFGDNKEAFDQYANYQARSQLIFRYAL